MGVIQLVRHGQASFGAPDYDVLSELGRQQAGTLGSTWCERDRAAAAYVSGTLRRQRDTATIARSRADGTDDIAVDAAWDEYASLPAPSSELVGAPDRDVQEAHNATLGRWMQGDRHGPETYLAFSNRVRRGFDSLVEASGPGTVTRVFTSAGPIALIASNLLTGGDAKFRSLKDVLVNAGVTTVIVGRSGPRVLAFNEQAHLAPEQVTFR